MRVVLLCLAVFHCGIAADPKVIWTGPSVNLLGTPSRDGKLLSYVDPETRNLAIRQLGSGQTHILTKHQGGEYAYFSAISRDADRIAYAWFNSAGFYELRVIDVSGENPRVIFRNEEAGFVQPCAWTSDGRHILTLLFRKDNISQIALVPADGGPPQVLRSLMWVYPKRMDLSPDGKYIVYDSFAKDNAGDRTVFALSLDGKTETRLIDTPGDYLFPLWTPDGKRIAYIADHDGTTDLWTLDIADGKPVGEPLLVRRDIGRSLPLGITASNEFIYGVRAGETDVFVTTLSAARADAKRASARYPGRNMSPAWSSDGAHLAYLSRRGSENFGQESRAIVVRSLETGAERELLPKLAHMERVRWAADNTTLLVSGSDGKGRAGLFRVDVNTAAAAPLIREADAPFRGYEGLWSHDGAAIIFIRDNEIRSHILSTGVEASLYKGIDLHHLVGSPDGKTMAVASGTESIVLLGDNRRLIPFPGVTELDWGRDLIAAKGAALWRVPLDGTPPVELETPGNRKPGFNVHPDGNRIALTVSNARSEVWSISLDGLRIPAGLDAYIPTPQDNPITKEGVRLGRQLFFDKRLSRDNTMSCATCHDPQRAFTDSRKVAVGIGGRTGERRVPRIVNRAYGKTFFWDGRVSRLEEQVVMPIANPKEMDLDIHEAATRVGIDTATLQRALASYVRTIFSGASPYDLYVQGKRDALTDEQKLGLQVFRGKGGCISCHLGPNLTDERLHNTGIGQEPTAFKTPSLREAARTPPYMHDGSLATLEDVIDYYDKGGRAHPGLDPEIRPLRLTADEKKALVAFLQSLNGVISDGL